MYCTTCAWAPSGGPQHARVSRRVVARCVRAFIYMPFPLPLLLPPLYCFTLYASPTYAVRCAARCAAVASFVRSLARRLRPRALRALPDYAACVLPTLYLRIIDCFFFSFTHHFALRMTEIEPVSPNPSVRMRAAILCIWLVWTLGPWLVRYAYLSLCVRPSSFRSILLGQDVWYLACWLTDAHRVVGCDGASVCEKYNLRVGKANGFAYFLIYSTPRRVALSLLQVYC